MTKNKEPAGEPGQKTIVLVSPHGFCAGVRRAIDIVEAALDQLPHPIYCLREIVHNRQVVDGLRRKGVIFVNDLADVPPTSTLLFSAHGVTPQVRSKAGERRFNVIDATCPFVAKVHTEVRKYASLDYTIILIGFRKHDEVVGVVGEAPSHVVVAENADEAARLSVKDPEKIAVITQTTLSADETSKVHTVLKSRFPKLVTPAQSDICYATTNRQNAVMALADRVRTILVLGSRNSSNSNRLVEVARTRGAAVHLIDSMPDLDTVPLDGLDEIGLTAGASTPDSFIREVTAQLKRLGYARIEVMQVATENIHFPLPPQLKRIDNTGTL
ncbi:MAG: 4-hydroxy-3-methylbut-2-enyl diphosphate reductase [Verrucomicrobia bacterium]|nr:4-hydroxy-3-methylbut-2-enyl diphosphate reductase [Verrucomicrobiota bacterium]